jgi:negative regulator of sigma E activity
MSDENESSDFERRAKRAFDDSVAALDAATRSRLTQARYRALEERAPRQRRGWLSALVPAGASAATALVAWLVVWPSPPASEDVHAASLSDLEILLGEEDLEMLDEELEFYGWLEEQPEFVDDSVG